MWVVNKTNKLRPYHFILTRKNVNGSLKNYNNERIIHS